MRLVSPILISVYNRENHFCNCINSIAKNELLKDSHLFIAIDYPLNEKDYIANKNIIDFAKNIKGPKKLDILIRSKNYGSYRNIFDAIDEILKIYDTFIFSEDDNVFSPHFLSFVNSGLENYYDRNDIFSISGYNYPIKIPNDYKQSVYIWQGLSAWGFGTWKHKWNIVDRNIKQVETWLKNKEHLKKLDKVAQHYRYALKTMALKNIINGDGYYSSYLVENDMYSIFPIKTFVKNFGHDGSGNNKFLSNEFTKQELNEVSEFNMPFTINQDYEISRELWKYFSNYNRAKKRLFHYLYPIIKYVK